MGFKRRNFTGTLKVEITKILATASDGISKKDLLGNLRKAPGLRVSIRRLGLALNRLLADGKIDMVGSRGGARFKNK
jgi:hypothetical protein